MPEPASGGWGSAPAGRPLRKGAMGPAALINGSGVRIRPMVSSGGTSGFSRLNAAVAFIAVGFRRPVSSCLAREK